MWGKGKVKRGQSNRSLRHREEVWLVSILLLTTYSPCHSCQTLFDRQVWQNKACINSKRKYHSTTNTYFMQWFSNLHLKKTTIHIFRVCHKEALWVTVCWSRGCRHCFVWFLVGNTSQNSRKCIIMIIIMWSSLWEQLFICLIWICVLLFIRKC